MGKETKIGLAVIGSLLVCFGYVLYSRISKETAAASLAKAADKTKPAAEKSAKAPLSSGPNKAPAAKPKNLSSGPAKPNLLTADAAAASKPSSTTYGSGSPDPFNRTPAAPLSAASTTDNPYSRPSFRYSNDPVASDPVTTASSSVGGPSEPAATKVDVPSFRSAANAVGAAASDIYRSAGDAASSLASPPTTAPAGDPFANIKKEVAETGAAVAHDAKHAAQQTADALKSAAEQQPGRLEQLANDAAAELDARARDAQHQLGETKEAIANTASKGLDSISHGENPLRPAPFHREQDVAPVATATPPVASTRQALPSYGIYGPPAATEPADETSAHAPAHPARSTPQSDPLAATTSAADETPNTYSAPPLGSETRAPEATAAPEQRDPPGYSPTQNRYGAADRYRSPPPPAAETATAPLATPPSSFRSRQLSPPPSAMPLAPTRGALPQADDRADSGTSTRSALPAARSYTPTAIPSSSASLGGGQARASIASRRVSGDRYVVEPNDNYWLISEKRYGNGAYFKALQEHNRDRYPLAERLQAGDELSTPPLETLQQNYPQLCPKPQRLEQAQRAAGSYAARQTTGRTYVVEAGDTLFDIARFELGKASRWSEIYELNKDALGQDFNHLSPGMKLALPNDGQGDNVTRRPGLMPR